MKSIMGPDECELNRYLEVSQPGNKTTRDAISAPQRLIRNAITLH